MLARGRGAIPSGMTDQILGLIGILLIPSGLLLLVFARLRWNRTAAVAGVLLLALAALLLVLMHYSSPSALA